MTTMNDTSVKQPARITGADVSRLARQGSERALAVREAATDLTADQAKQVGGGFFLLPIIFGGFPFPVLDTLVNKAPVNPQAPVNATTPLA
jgi:hypothetical protein